MNELYNQLKQGYPDYSDQQIIELIGKLASHATALKARLLTNGYPQSYVDGLSMPELFNLGGQGGGQGALPLATGQNELNREAEGFRDLETAYGGRAGAGAQLAVLLQKRDEDRKAAETDPYRLAEDLVNRAALPAGTGSPYQALLGSGTYIDPKPYEEDPRLTSLIDRLDKYVRMEPPAEDPQIAAVRAAYARDPVAAARYFGASEPDRQRLGHARGGDVTLREPVVGIGAHSGDVLFTAAENGPEDMSMGKKSMMFKPRPGVSRKMKPGRQRQIIGQVKPFAKGGGLKIGGGGFAAFLKKNHPEEYAKNVANAATRQAFKNRAGPGARDKNWRHVTVDGRQVFLSDTGDYYGDGGARAAAEEKNRKIMARQGVGWGGAPETGLPSGQNDYEGGETAQTAAYSVARGQGGGGSLLAPREVPSPEMRQRTLIDDLLGPAPGTVSATPRGMTRPNRPYAANRYARYAVPNRASGGAINLRSATAIALGKSLRNSPFAHPDMLARLLAGEAPLPGQVTDRFRKNVLDRDEVMRGAFDSMIKTFGVKSPASYFNEARTYDPRGIGMVTVRR